VQPKVVQRFTPSIRGRVKPDELIDQVFNKATSCPLNSIRRRRRHFMFNDLDG
jgi:hypothetical protein